MLYAQPLSANTVVHELTDPPLMAGIGAAWALLFPTLRAWPVWCAGVESVAGLGMIVLAWVYWNMFVKEKLTRSPESRVAPHSKISLALCASCFALVCLDAALWLVYW